MANPEDTPLRFSPASGDEVASSTSPRRYLLVLHPFFFALYPILALLAVNFQELAPGEALRSLLLVPVAVLVLFLVLRLLYRDWHRAGVAATFLVLIAFSYGHVYLKLERIQVAGQILGRHRYLIPLCLLAALLLLFWLWKARPNLHMATQVLNVVGAAAIVLTLLSMVSTLGRIRSNPAPDSLASMMLSAPPAPPSGTPLPDVYYIILDGYARTDYMKSVFGYDNSEFMTFLKSRGFYVAEQSHTNHNYTALSLASSLNMTHTQNLGLRLLPGSYPGVFVGRIRHSLVRANFERMGYEIVGLRSSWIATEWIDADQYLGPDPVDINSLQEPFQFNAFEGMLLQSSVGLILTDLGGDKIVNWAQARNSQPYEVLREIILSEFDLLPQVAASPGPKFVFAHIVAPHAPYLFGPHGEAAGQSEAFTLAEPGLEGSSDSTVRYRDQAIFITGKIQTAIDGILANSAAPPIIILQADHGSGATPHNHDTSGEELRQRMSILNAYRLPDSCQSQLYPTISPINSFRLLFDCVYGADYPLLADDTYYSPWPYENDYSFTLVNDLLK